MQQSFDLDTVLMDLSGPDYQTLWTIRDAVEGVQIFGGIGSGKTSGSGRMIALKYLSAGFGGLVLTAKHDEKELWQEYCKITGRSSDLIIVEPDGEHYFNFLEYESSAARGSRSLTLNTLQVLKTVIRAKDEKSSGKGDDKFWETALDLFIANLIDLCQLAYGKITIEQLFEIAQSAPKKDAPMPRMKENIKEGEKAQTPFERAFELAFKRIENKHRAWKARQTDEYLKSLPTPVYERMMIDLYPETRTLEFVNDFFLETFKPLSEKTRSIIDFSLLGFLYGLLQEPTYSLFCKHASTFTPEDCLNGKIILINIPVKDFHHVGQDSQIMFKYIWQRAMERRRVKENGRPVFLWADEAQNFLHEHDADYQATARSSRIATVYISQNLPNYYANMGGQKAEHKVKSFLGTLSTKIFHANADFNSNAYASQLIGDAYFIDIGSSITYAKEFSQSKSQSIKLDKLVRPEHFFSLKTGGPANNLKVEGYVVLQGKEFAPNMNHAKITFPQNYTPTK